MSSKSKSPEDLVIRPRDRRFRTGDTPHRFWLQNDPIATAFYNALSITLPYGEAFFIESLKAFRTGLPDKLAKEVEAFISQEALHSREHVALNKSIAAQNYDVSYLKQQVAVTLGALRRRSPVLKLTVTTVLEHYTAVLAVQFLNDQDLAASSKVDQVALWRWHAVEEIEHKGVAYDVWLHVTRDWSALRRWITRTIAMLLVSASFWVNRYRAILSLLEQDGISGAKAHVRLLRYLFGTPGVQRKVMLPLLAYCLPGFHPWNRDDRHLIVNADREDGTVHATPLV